MNAIEYVVWASLGGTVAGFLLLWRTWVALAVEVYRHGMDNHSCNRECCR